MSTLDKIMDITPNTRQPDLGATIGEISTAFSDGSKPALTELDLDEMLKIAMTIKPEKIPERMLVIGCKKHIDAIDKATRNENGPVWGKFTGTNVTFYVKPYLKKIRVINLPEMYL